MVSLTDGKGQTTRWGYDAYGRALAKTNAANQVVWTNGYDANGWLTTHWTPAKLGASYAHDAVGNVTGITFATSPAIGLAYDALNRLTNMLDAVGTTRFAWTEIGTLASTGGLWPQDTVSCSYNLGGRRSGLSLAAPNVSAWTQSYAYDAAWRLTNLVSPAGAFSYQYGVGAGATSSRIKRLTLPNAGVVTNAYDSLGRLLSTTLQGLGGAAVNRHGYQYDVGHERTSQTFTAGNYFSYGYDPLGQLTSAVGRESGGTLRLQEQLSYGYDTAGNLTGRTNNAWVTALLLNNALNELSAVSQSGTLTVAGMTTPAAIAVYVADNNNPAAPATLYADKTFARPNVPWLSGSNTFAALALDGRGRYPQDRVTNVLTATLTCQYDANGNLLTDGRRVFGYDDANQLIAVWVTNWVDDATLSEFVYDGLGRRRVRREKVWQSGGWVVTSETRYVYDGLEVIQERDANNVPQVTYTRGIDLSGRLGGAGGIGGLLAQTTSLALNPRHYYYHGDGGGNVTALLDANATVVARYVYDPFGTLEGMAGPMAEGNLYRVSSKEFHAPSGLYYYGFRFYDPSLQRWLNPDPIEEAGGINLYGFLENDPLAYVDPLGLEGGYEYAPDGRMKAPSVCPPLPPEWAFEGLLATADQLLSPAEFEVTGFHGEKCKVVILTPGTVRGRVAGACKSLAKRLTAKAAETELHHLLPQSKTLAPFFKRAGLNIEDYRIPLDKAAHHLLPNGIHTGPAAESWNGVWKQFFDANPGASKQAILDQLAKMRNDFGI